MALNFLLKRSGTASKRPVAGSMALGELDLNYDSATGGLYYKDSSGNVVKVGPTQVSATAPNVAPAGSAGNSAGECWFDTANQVLKVWDGSAWVNAVSTSEFLPLSGGTMTGDITFSGTQSIPVSSIQSASTSQAGVVQLNDTTSSTSTTEALTANQGKELQDQINALSVTSNLTFAGTIDASTGNVVTVTSEGSTAGFTIGDPLPSAASGNDNYFVIVTVPGTMTPPGGSSQECHQGDWWLSDGSAWEFLDVGFNATAATTSTPGVVQLATDAEVQAGLNTNHAVTPSGLQSKLSDSTSTTSSTEIASSTAVKSAYDAGIQGQTDAAAALAAANTAGADVGVLASLTTTDKSSAVAAINEVNAAAGAAQSDATQALSDAAAAQADADQAILDAAAAQTDATQALSDAAAAQSDATQALSDASSAQATADAAVPNSAYTALGDILSGTGAGTYSALSLGTNAQVLTVDTACPAGLKWAAAVSQATPTTLGGVYGRGTGNNLSLGYESLGAITTGVANTAVGSGAGPSLTSGRCNVAFGTDALYLSTADQHNTAVGYAALLSMNGGSRNTAIGSSALYYTSSGCDNIAIGYASGCDLSTGSLNVIIGRCVQVADWGGSCQLAIGFSASDNWLTGDSTKAIKPGAGIIDCAGSCGTAGQVLMSDGANAVCWGTAGGGGGSPATPTVEGIVYGCTDAVSNVTALGPSALLSLAGGTGNVGVGAFAGCSLTTGNDNIAIGCRALTVASTSYENVAIGPSALEYAQTGNNNVAIGRRAGRCIISGIDNVAVGRNALEWNEPGSYNVGVGARALRNACGNANIGIGYSAGYGNDGEGNIFVGFNAGTASNGGSHNILLGYQTGSCVTEGSCNTILGSFVTPDVDVSCCLMIGVCDIVTPSGFNWITGDSTGAIKPGAGIIDCAGSCGTAGQVLASNGANAICWKTLPTPANATPTVAGIVLGCTVGNGCSTAIGCNALVGQTSGTVNVGVGHNAGVAITTGLGNTAIGSCAGDSVVGGNFNTLVGASAGCLFATSSSNIAIGAYAGSGATGGCNIFIGVQSGCVSNTGSCNVVIGTYANALYVAGSCQLAIGFDSGQYWLTGTCTKAIKPGAGIIDCADSCGTAGQVLMSNGSNAICWGAVSLPAATPSVAGAVFGRTGGGAVGIGEGIFTVSEPILAVAVGCQALAQAQLFAQQNTALGNRAGFGITTGQGNTLVGSLAGCTITTGSGNIAFSPNNSGLTVAPVFTLTTQCNRVVMGSTSVTNAYIQVAWTAVSDARDKTNITALPVGLDFVNQLNPVSYQFKENRESSEAYGPVRYGFLAQEVLEAEGENPVIVDAEDTEKLKITYDHMNAVLVKAIQELSAKNDALEARLAALENQ